MMTQEGNYDLKYDLGFWRGWIGWGWRRGGCKIFPIFFLNFAQNNSIYGSINVIFCKQRDICFAVRVVSGYFSDRKRHNHASFKGLVLAVEILQVFFCPIRIWRWKVLSYGLITYKP